MGSMKRWFVYLTILATMGLMAWPASAGKENANRAPGVISVPDAVYGGSTVATVNPGGDGVYVFLQCYAPTFGGEYVHAKYFDVDANGQAAIGPLMSRLWLSGEADCTAQEGYFTRNGFGKWVVVAATTFHVAAA